MPNPPEETAPLKDPRTVRGLNKVLVLVDEIVLVLVAIGIIGVAGMLLFEAYSDLVYYTRHSISHIISDLMFVLIVMELFRQVFRQINRQPLSLDPFIYIGVIASIRGMLLTQMRHGLGEEEWDVAMAKVGVHAAVVVVLIAGLLLYSRTKSGPREPD